MLSSLRARLPPGGGLTPAVRDRSQDSWVLLPALRRGQAGMGPGARASVLRAPDGRQGPSLSPELQWGLMLPPA